MSASKLTAPSAWASYLVNGDDSGIDDAERAAADQFAEWLGAPIIGCEDAGFCSRHAAWQFYPLATDCQEYEVLDS